MVSNNAPPMDHNEALAKLQQDQARAEWEGMPGPMDTEQRTQDLKSRVETTELSDHPFEPAHEDDEDPTPNLPKAA